MTRAVIKFRAPGTKRYWFMDSAGNAVRTRIRACVMDLEYAKKEAVNARAQGFEAVVVEIKTTM